MESAVRGNEAERFVGALKALKEAPAFAKSLYQTDLFQEAARLMDTPEGRQHLYRFADQFDQAGVFADGPWEDPNKLQPSLVRGTLRAGDIHSIIEILSDLRMLAIAKGTYRHPAVSDEEARAFLNEVMALNLDFLFPGETEAERIEQNNKTIRRAQQMMQFIGDQITLTALAPALVREIDRLTAQRPIMVNRIVSIIAKARRLLDGELEADERQAIERYVAAISETTALSRRVSGLRNYHKALKDADEETLTREAETFASSMRQTGLVSPYHTVLVRHLNRHHPVLLARALDLTGTGAAHLEEHAAFVSQLINVAIHPAMPQSLYGLARMLDRGVLSAPPVIPGLRRLIELDMQPEIRQLLLGAAPHHEGLTPNAILVAGTVSVLGQPLGVGQGLNPTCQTARGISLWALHAQGRLLGLIARAARDGDIDIEFEGNTIHSKALTGGLVEELHKELDPVSLVLVPHLDRIYGELTERSKFRGEDVHKWVNPAFYGNWVNRGFSSVIDAYSGAVTDYPGFVRLFYATHHPEYNEQHELIYPNPVGIFLTNVHGKLLGLHAVSIQRVARDPRGEYRIYFYNPNNDSTQNWGQGIVPTVRGHGEEPGESSLPFPEFVARLYAFHYNPYEQGDAYGVEDEVVERISALARESWGREYPWIGHS